MARYIERNKQVIRQWELLRALEEAPRTRPELAALLGTTVRTVHRDLDALQAARFPLYSERHDDGHVRWHLLGTRPAPARRVA
jgi:predicted DNA-binding transcriptional regulator YafY